MTGNDRNYVVYCHTNLTNGKRYIGISKNVESRWKSAGSGYTSRGKSAVTAFDRAIQKYGWDGFRHEILNGGLTRSEACQLEKEYIAKYKTNICRYGKDFGYNMTDGGDGWAGHKLSEQEIEMRRQQAKLRGMSEKCKAASITASKKPVKCVETGEVFPSATEAASVYSISQTHLCACCHKRRETAHGLHWEWASADELTSFYQNGGSYLTEVERESLVSVSDKVRKNELAASLVKCSYKPVQCVETGVIYDSLTSAAEAVGGSMKNISSCLRGKAHTSAGYHWRYVS